MTPQETGLIRDWPRYLSAGVLVMTRLSGLFVFAPVFNSAAISPRVKAGFVFAMTILLAPVVTAVAGAHAELDMGSVLGELGVGLLFGFSLSLLMEALIFAGALLGMEFSFSLVNLQDPNSRVETPVLGQMVSWLGILVILGAGLDRTLLAAVVRSFMVVPVGRGVDPGYDGCGSGTDGGRNLSFRIAARLAGDCGGAGGGGDGSADRQAVSATADAGAEYSDQDDGVVHGADWVTGGLAWVD